MVELLRNSNQERQRKPKLSPEIQGSIDANKINASRNNLSTKGQATAKSQRRGGVLRYPLEMMTQETDYLQIDIQKYIPLQSYRSVPGDNSRYVTGNNFTNRAGRRLSQNLSTKPLINDGTILLPIPK